MMKLNDLVNQSGEWLKATGAESDIVMSSRIRFARNLKGLSFAHWADEKEKKQVLANVKEVLLKNNYLKNSLFLRMDELNELDKRFLVERHLISRELAAMGSCKAVDISDKELFSIMINEEDHLRLQVLQSGLELKESLRLLENLDNELQKDFDYACSSKWGYLTACPTNVGTGMRASVMVHLPALVMAKRIGKVLESIARINLAVRGLYGEGTEASGNLFQISNQITLGHSEKELVDSIERVIKQVIEYERRARDVLMRESREQLEDKIWRAYGILSNSRIISSLEVISLLSAVRLGINLSIINKVDAKTVNELFIITQPAHLQKIEGRTLSPQERDIKRADLLRSKLK
jgi:protein arginine kinase